MTAEELTELLAGRPSAVTWRLSNDPLDLIAYADHKGLKAFIRCYRGDVDWYYGVERQGEALVFEQAHPADDVHSALTMAEVALSVEASHG